MEMCYAKWIAVRVVFGEIQLNRIGRTQYRYMEVSGYEVKRCVI